MALTPILGIQQVATNQSNKEATINDAILALEGAGNGTLTLDYSTLSGDYVLSESLFSRNFLFKPVNQPAGVTAITLHLPRTVNGHPVQRIFVIKNSSTAGITVFITGAQAGTSGATGVLLPEGSARLMAMDGDDLIIASEATTASRFIDLTDVPPTYEGKKGLTYRVKQDETGLEFVDGLSVGELSDTDTTGKADGSILRFNGSSQKWVATPLSLINTFLGLSDTPDSFAGMAGYLLHVNAAANSLEFINPLSLGGPVTGGGNTGQVLTKLSATDGDYGWNTPGLPLPAGGVAGQYLKKNSAFAGDAGWVDLPAPVKELPSGGTAGQVLAKITNVDGAVEWVDSSKLQESFAPAIVNSVAVSLLNGDRFTLPWTPTVGNALIVGYFSNVTITAQSGWVEMAALTANSWWNGAKTFGRIVQTSDTSTIAPCNVGTADAAVVFEIDMRYLAGGLPGLVSLMGYSDTNVPEVVKPDASVIIAGTANRGGAHPAYTVTGTLFNTSPSQDSTHGGNRYAGGVFIDPADAGATVDISYDMGSGGASGVYFYIVLKAISAELEEAPTDGQRYVRRNKVWAVQGAALPAGGNSGQILFKLSQTDGDASWGDAPAGVPAGGTASQVLTKNSGVAGDYTWKTVGLVPVGGSTGQILTKKSGSDLDTQWSTAPLGLPTGGAVGKILVKSGTGDGAASWSDPPHELPTGGAQNQYLVKNTAGDFDVVWKSGPTGIPTGGTVGQILTKNSSTDGDFSWKVAPTGVPTGGLTGQVLTKVSPTDGDVAWQTVAAGGSSSVTVTDGTTSVSSVSKIKFSGATVTDAGSGEVDVAVSGGGGGGGGITWSVSATGTGAPQNIPLPFANIPAFKAFVFVNGLRYRSSEYNIAGAVLTMTSNAAGDMIEILGPDGDIPTDPYSVPGITAAYGFRQITTTYTGPLFKAYRTLDSAQQDFYPASDGTFDPATLGTWSGGSDVKLITWYDQSNNGHHITTVTPGDGCRLVIAGVPQTVAGKLVGNWDSPRRYSVPFTLIDTENYVFDLLQLGGSDWRSLHHTQLTSSHLSYGFKSSSGQMGLQRNGSADNEAGAVITSGSNHLVTWHGPAYTPGTYTIEQFLDGAANGNPSLAYSDAMTSQHDLASANGADSFFGKIGELAFYKRAMTTSERQSVETQMRQVWGI